MRVAHAVIGGLVLGCGLGWWALGHPGYETGEQTRARVEAARQAQEEAKPKLYRWRDDNGVLQLTGQPPAGRKYELVKMQEDVNVIPMSGPAPDTTPPK